MDQPDKDPVMSRRALFGAAGAAAASLALAGSGMAQDHDHGGHAGHGGDAGHGGHAGHGAHAALIEASAACVQTGEACLAHCLKLLGQGDTSIKECAEAVSAMLPVSQSLLRLAAMDAKRLKFFGVVASDFLKDCRAQCKRHAPDHAECKACMDACDVALEEVRKLIV